MQASVQIGPYQVLRLIKSGGQGRVYLGYDTRLQRKVALKILPLLHPARARNAQLREAQMLAAIHSERVVEIYDRVVSRHVLALVMEYVPGCDLEELLVGGRLPLSCTLAVAADIAAALAVVRQAQFVHGDLKASNVLIGRNGRAKLTDLGVAASTRGAASGISAGSLSALAPEQVRGGPIDVRTDLFALGCLIYRMLTGLHPFLVNGKMDVDAILAGKYPEVGQVLSEADANAIPGDLVQLVDELMQVVAESRPQNTHEVRRRLRAISRGMPLTMHTSVADVATPFFRRENPDDLPPDIPMELIEKGRSYGRARAMAPQKPFRYSHALGGLVLASALLIMLAWGWLSGTLPNSARDIEIVAPQLVADGAAKSALRVYPDAIRAAIADGVRDESIGIVLGATGDGENHTVVSGSLPVRTAIADERIESRVECRSQLCLLSLRRVRPSGAENPVTSFQVAVFSDAPPENWQAAIVQGLKALYTL